MARGRHYAKLSLSNAARLSFSDLCILLFMFLSLCRLCVCVFLCSHWSLVDVPLIFFCPADHVPDWQPRVLLGMVEARSVNVKKTTTTTTVDASLCYYNHRGTRLNATKRSPRRPCSLCSHLNLLGGCYNKQKVAFKSSRHRLYREYRKYVLLYVCMAITYYSIIYMDQCHGSFDIFSSRRWCGCWELLLLLTTH